MFCDHCDRGYHSYCVGLKEIPKGNVHNGSLKNLQIKQSQDILWKYICIYFFHVV